MESFLTSQRSHVFTSAAVLIFVFDIESASPAADIVNYSEVLRALHEFSPTAKIFALIHKMDLVPPQNKHEAFEKKADLVRRASEEEGFSGNQIEFWATSIWDQSLYKAWTQVMYYLVPNASTIELMLRRLAELIDAHELMLYERTTCLLVTSVTRGAESKNPYSDRFERISSILKTHKHSMSKHTGIMPSAVSFAELQIKTGNFMFFITRLTENTNLAVVVPGDESAFNAARVNIQLARQEFAHLDIVEKAPKMSKRVAGLEQVMPLAVPDGQSSALGSEAGDTASGGHVSD